MPVELFIIQTILFFVNRQEVRFFFDKGIFFESEGYVVSEINAKFLKPAKLGDIIEIKTEIIEIKRASLKVKHQIYKENEKLFEAVISLAYIKNNKLSKIPEKHLKILNEQCK